jgi:signal transduction histidine kinase
VADSGPGLTAEQLAHAWQPFTQVDRSTTRRHDGLGLGLPVSRKVCEALGGSLELTATPGQGCVAVVSLPGALV